MSFTGHDLRSTLAYVTDPAGSSFLGATAYSAPIGYVNAVPFAADRTTTADPRLAGAHTISTINTQLRRDLSNGSYKFRIGSGAAGVSARQQVMIWDGALADGATAITSSNFVTRADATLVALGRYTISGDKLYRCTTGGTTGTGTAPTGTGSDIVDGTAHWAWVKTALVNADSISSVPNGSVVDAAGATLTYAAWAANSGASAGSGDVAATVTQGYVTLSFGPGATSTQLRHFAFELQTTPLQDVTLTDTFDQAISTSPEIYANQPAGKYLAKLGIAAGSADVADWSLGGDLAPYFALKQVGVDIWLTAGPIRLPDAATATTLNLIQTDGNPAITGSPHTTALTPTILSSGGRVTTGSSVLALISTEAYVARAAIVAPHLTKWQGYAGESFVRDNTVASAAAFLSELTAIAALGATAGWMRIRCQDGDWSADVTVPVIDRPVGGGLLIEPDTGHDPEITGQWTTTGGLRRVEFTGLRFARVNPDVTGVAFPGWSLVFSPPSDAVTTIVRVTSNRFGAAYNSGGFTEADHARFAWLLRAFYCEQIDVLDNEFNGFDNGLEFYGCRLVESARNDFQQAVTDCHNVSAFRGGEEHKGLFADDHCYFWPRDNTVRNVVDRVADYAPTFSDTPHGDFVQVKRTTCYPNPNLATDPSVAGDVVLGQWANINGNYYECITAGTTAGDGVGPTGTGADIVDGTAHWAWRSTVLDGPRVRRVIEGNNGVSAGVDYGDEAGLRYAIGMQFHIYSGDDDVSEAVVIDNVWSSRSAYGYKGATNNLGEYVEHNSFVGPPELPPTTGHPEVAGDPSIFVNSDTPTKLLQARKNIAATIYDGSGVTARQCFNEDNLIASYKADPGASLTGPFTDSDADGIDLYAIDDSGAASQTAFRTSLRAIMRPLSGNYGAVVASGRFRPRPLSLGLTLSL